MRDRNEEGREEIRRWMDGRWVNSREKMGIYSRPSLLAMLVEAHLEMKQPAAGLKVLEEAFSPRGAVRENGCTSRSCFA